MILADRDIKRAIEKDYIVVRPQPDWEKQLGSCSLDLHLGSIASYIGPTYVKARQKGKLRKSNFRKKDLGAGEFRLGVTEEYLELPDDICGMLHGRSSLGRKGLMIHSTAPLIDAGFRGRIVLEFYNAGPAAITLKTGMRVCSVSFERLSSPVSVPYHKKKNAKFIGQERP